MLSVRGGESVPPVDLALARSSKKEAVGDIGEVDPVDSGSYPVDNVRSCSIPNHRMGVSTPVPVLRPTSRGTCTIRHYAPWVTASLAHAARLSTPSKPLR